MNIRLLAAIYAVLILVMIWLFITPPEYRDFDDDATKLAKCLRAKKFRLYCWMDTEVYPECTEQREMFGPGFRYIYYFDCYNERLPCSFNNVDSFPTWMQNQTKYRGLKTLEQLREISGC